MYHFQFNTVTVIAVLMMAILAAITLQQFWRMSKNPKKFINPKKWRARKKKTA
jgi:ABC-type Fe3+ transport system permease subunit